MPCQHRCNTTASLRSFSAQRPDKKHDWRQQDQRRDDPPVGFLPMPPFFFNHTYYGRSDGCDHRDEHDRQSHGSAVRATKYSFRGEVKQDQRSWRNRGQEQMPKESFPGLQRLSHFHRMPYMLIDLMSLCLYFGIEATMLQ